MQNEENNVDIEGAEPRIYEVGYLLLPTVTEENLPAVYGNMKELVASLGGTAISDEMPHMMGLAYPMVKVLQNVRHTFETAYFGWMKFEMDPAKVGEIKKKLDLDPEVLRFLTMKTVKENTVATKRFTRPDMRRRSPSAKKEGDAPEAPINKEEIDQEIEAMVAA